MFDSVEAIQMSINNMCILEEVDKSIGAIIWRTRNWWSDNMMNYSVRGQQRPWLNCENKLDMNLPCPHIQYGSFIYLMIHMSSNVRKLSASPDMSAQWRLKSASVSALSDQRTRCGREQLHHWLSKFAQWFLIRLRKCEGWSESSLGAVCFQTKWFM